MIAFVTRDKTQKLSAMTEGVRYSLTFLELILTSVSRTIFETFKCSGFDVGTEYETWALYAQLTLPCDNSPRRKWWKAYAIICVFICELPLLLALVEG